MSLAEGVSGPLFTIGEAVCERLTEEAVKEMAKEGKAQWLNYLGERLVNPTGYYESNIDYEMTSGTNARVDDNHVVYGGWLEGISWWNSQRNFAGYFSAQDTRDYLSQFGDGILSRNVVGRFMAMLR
jgi:hypothetical protein